MKRTIENWLKCYLWELCQDDTMSRKARYEELIVYMRGMKDMMFIMRTQNWKAYEESKEVLDTYIGKYQYRVENM